MYAIRSYYEPFVNPLSRGDVTGGIPDDLAVPNDRRIGLQVVEGNLMSLRNNFV